jgi:hypothetical protein
MGETGAARAAVPGLWRGWLRGLRPRFAVNARVIVDMRRVIHGYPPVLHAQADARLRWTRAPGLWVPAVAVVMVIQPVFQRGRVRSAAGLRPWGP